MTEQVAAPETGDRLAQPGSVVPLSLKVMVPEPRGVVDPAGAATDAVYVSA